MQAGAGGVRRCHNREQFSPFFGRRVLEDIKLREAERKKKKAEGRLAAQKGEMAEDYVMEVVRYMKKHPIINKKINIVCFFLCREKLPKLDYYKIDILIMISINGLYKAVPIQVKSSYRGVGDHERALESKRYLKKIESGLKMDYGGKIIELSSEVLKRIPVITVGEKDLLYPNMYNMTTRVLFAIGEVLNAEEI